MSAHHNSDLCGCGKPKPAHLISCSECEDGVSPELYDRAYKSKDPRDRRRAKREFRAFTLRQRQPEETEAWRRARA